MGDMEIPDELIDQLLGEYEGPEQLTGPDGLINRLRKRLIERAAGAELEQHLGYPPAPSRPRGSRTGATASRRRRCGRLTGRSRSGCHAIATRRSSRGSSRSTPVRSTASTSRSSPSTPAG